MIYIRAKIEVENQTEEIELEIRDAILHAIKNNHAVNYAKVEVVLPSVTASTIQSTGPELTISKSYGTGMKSEIDYYATDRATAMIWWNRDLTDQERERLCIIYGRTPITGREIEMIWRHEMAKNLKPVVVKSGCDCLFPDWRKKEGEMICGNCNKPKK